jgi:hypothetical protein
MLNPNYYSPYLTKRAEKRRDAHTRKEIKFLRQVKRSNKFDTHIANNERTCVCVFVCVNQRREREKIFPKGKVYPKKWCHKASEEDYKVKYDIEPGRPSLLLCTNVHTLMKRFSVEILCLKRVTDASPL